MKLRDVLLLVGAATILTVGCGSSDKGKDDSASKKDKEAAAKLSPEEEQEQAKEEALDDAKKAFDDDPKDANACRNLGLSYIAVASPVSSGDPKKPVEPPKDREENLEKAVGVLETCAELDPKDEGIASMLASSYMATGTYDKAARILERLAKARGGKDANAYYAWGLAASNAQDNASAIRAWSRFVQLAPRKDPRLDQVKQSIAALKAASKKPAAKPAADPGGGEESDDDEKDEE